MRDCPERKVFVSRPFLWLLLSRNWVMLLKKIIFLILIAGGAAALLLGLH
uniref:Uncharacterized protein n=1 Tax=Octopus bimaculoides TaxID=37653 RepID=A0A0L8G5N7_OCTBM